MIELELVYNKYYVQEYLCLYSFFRMCGVRVYGVKEDMLNVYQYCNVPRLYLTDRKYDKQYQIDKNYSDLDVIDKALDILNPLIKNRLAFDTIKNFFIKSNIKRCFVCIEINLSDDIAESEIDRIYKDAFAFYSALNKLTNNEDNVIYIHCLGYISCILKKIEVLKNSANTFCFMNVVEKISKYHSKNKNDISITMLLIRLLTFINYKDEIDKYYQEVLLVNNISVKYKSFILYRYGRFKNDIDLYKQAVQNYNMNYKALYRLLEKNYQLYSVNKDCKKLLNNKEVNEYFQKLIMCFNTNENKYFKSEEKFLNKVIELLNKYKEYRIL